MNTKATSSGYFVSAHSATYRQIGELFCIGVDGSRRPDANDSSDGIDFKQIAVFTDLDTKSDVPVLGAVIVIPGCDFSPLLEGKRPQSLS